MGKSGRLAMNASVASSICSIASLRDWNFGRPSPGAASFIEPDVSTIIAIAAPRPSSTAASYGASARAARGAGAPSGSRTSQPAVTVMPSSQNGQRDVPRICRVCAWSGAASDVGFPADRGDSRQSNVRRHGDQGAGGKRWRTSGEPRSRRRPINHKSTRITLTMFLGKNRRRSGRKAARSSSAANDLILFRFAGPRPIGGSGSGRPRRACSGLPAVSGEGPLTTVQDGWLRR